MGFMKQAADMLPMSPAREIPRGQKWSARRNGGNGAHGAGGMWMAGESGQNAVTPEMISGIAPEHILQDDEIVLMLVKPSLFFIFYTSIVFVLVALMMGVAAEQLTHAGGLGGYIGPTEVALITVLAVVGRLVWALLVWTSHIYMLTNLRVVTIKGVINVHMFQSQLRKIQKTEIFRPLGQRIFWTGTVGFSTAAAAGTVDSTWVMLSHPVETHQRIVAAISKAQGK